MNVQDTVAVRLDQLRAEEGVAEVDFFNARAGTPSVVKLQQYPLVLTFSNASYANSTALGNNLADYQDGGGIVVVTTFAFVSGFPTFSIQGRWLNEGYSPYNYGPNVFDTGSLGAYDPTHPLMQNIVNLTASTRADLTLTSGATLVASWADGTPIVQSGNAVAGEVVDDEEVKIEVDADAEAVDEVDLDADLEGDEEEAEEAEAEEASPEA